MEENNHLVKLNIINPKLRFMVKKISMPRFNMVCWLSVQEFSDVMTEWLNEGKTIDDTTVLPVLKEIYLEKKKLKDEGIWVGFNFKSARYSINKVEQALGIPHEKL